jgi:PEP-CTERM motif
MNRRIFALGAIAMLSANAAYATTYFDTISSPASLSLNVDGPGDGATLLAQSFAVPGLPDFSRVTLALSADRPADGGSFVVFLVPDDGSGGPSLAGFPQTALDVSGLVATGFANTFTLGTISDSQLSGSIASPSLISLSISSAALASVTSSTFNGEYWIGIDATGSTSVEWALSSDASGIGTDGQVLFNNAGNPLGGVSDLSLGAYQMIVDTPEPASLAILGGGLAALGFFRRRTAAKV